ncbi:hypothetical protein E1301_Tti013670 [Triplophysa tibetana]|uniref:BED-type domain-containing protein n=1 Tax=Triplophysa tibetana TaxID=1572043 RepID=A0A5A9PM55_9TELE|nr:hypothetical protein E1301_Tti013670 [Triplophysa tibetana]
MASSTCERTEVWNYFVQNDQHVMCKICLAKLSHHHSTTSMRNHMKSKHRNVIIDPPNEDVQLPFTAFATAGRRRCTPEQTEKTTQDFYTEDVLRGDATETWSSVLAEFSEAVKNVPEVILTNTSEVVGLSGVQGAPTTEGLTVPVKSSVDLPSNQYHLNHELMFEMFLIQLQESLNIHSELARRMYGCVDTLLSNSAEQEMAGKRVRSDDDDLNCCQQMRSVRGRNEHLSITEQLQEIIDQQIEVFGEDYRNFDMFLQDLDLPEAIDEPSSPNICEMLEEIIQMQNLDFEIRSNILQTGDGEINNSAEQNNTISADQDHDNTCDYNHPDDVIQNYIFH